MKVHGIIEETWLKIPNCFPLLSHGSSSLFTPTVRCQCSINARENPLGPEGEPHQNSISGPSWCFHRKNSLICSFIKQNQIILLCQMLVKWRYYWKFLNYLAAAAAAKSIQSCPTLCDPIDSSPPGFSIHGIFQARVLEWVAIALSERFCYRLTKISWGEIGIWRTAPCFTMISFVFIYFIFY